MKKDPHALLRSPIDTIVVFSEDSDKAIGVVIVDRLEERDEYTEAVFRIGKKNVIKPLDFFGEFIGYVVEFVPFE